MYLNVAGRTQRNTQFHIPLTYNEEINTASFIRFVDKSQQAARRPDLRRRILVNAPEVREAQQMRYEINISLDVTNDTETVLIFDKITDEEIRSRGTGSLQLNISNTRFDIRGTYTISEGYYQFVLQNGVIKRRFNIEQGGIITWSGDPMGALLNLKAVYTARPSLYNLMNDEYFKRTASVECILHITNLLTNPNLRFDVKIPNAEQEVQSFLAAATSSDEEMTKQFLALVAMNMFFPDANHATSSSSHIGLEMGLATASSFLTNQLSSMASQLSGVGVGFEVLPGNAETGSGGQNSLDISTDKWLLHINYEIRSEDAENTGEFLFERKLGDRNAFKLKLFRRSNAKYLSENPYTSGGGLLFRRDFNNLSDLFNGNRPPAVAPRREETELTLITEEGGGEDE
jgi:hypothetical protein